MTVDISKAAEEAGLGSLYLDSTGAEKWEFSGAMEIRLREFARLLTEPLQARVDELEEIQTAAFEQHEMQANLLEKTRGEYEARIAKLEQRGGVTEGWRARVNRRREKAGAQRAILLACIEDIRRRARETPAWERGYSSAITAIEIQLSSIKE